MGEKSAEKAPKKSFFKGMKAEFGKIIWPDKKTLARQSVAVVAVTVVLGLIIALLDMIIQTGINFLITL